MCLLCGSLSDILKSKFYNVNFHKTDNFKTTQPTRETEILHEATDPLMQCYSGVKIE